VRAMCGAARWIVQWVVCAVECVQGVGKLPGGRWQCAAQEWMLPPPPPPPPRAAAVGVGKAGGGGWWGRAGVAVDRWR